MVERGLSYTPPSRPLSRASWVDARCRALLERAVPELLQRASDLSPRLVFLGGSACLGEAVGWRDGDEHGPVLSDLDVGVITGDSTRVGAHSGLERALDELRAEGDPDVTLGLYSLGSLDRQAPTPGLVDIHAHGIPLAGDGALLARLRSPLPSAIPRYEAFRLVGSRALELLASAGDGPERRLHSLSKAALGIWTSWLIREGCYESRLLARIGLLEGAPGTKAPPAIRSAATAFARFAVDPGPAHAPEPSTGFELYRLALTEFLNQSGHPELPEIDLLREPLSPRDRFRLWRHGLSGGAARRLRALACVALEVVAHRDPVGTPQNRRLAAACLACRVGADGSDRDWARGAKRFLFRVPENGPGLAAELAELP